MSDAQDDDKDASDASDDQPVRRKAPSQALVVRTTSTPTRTNYRMPVPGRSWRGPARFGVLVMGSAAIGVGVAAGGFGVMTAALMATALATTQVVAQSWRQNRLGQAVVGSIAVGDLAAARTAAEQALVESPSGVMRTLAAANLASVLIQQDMIQEAGDVLDRHPPGFLQVPLATILWLNNRAFARLALTAWDANDVPTLTLAARLLDDAEARMRRVREADLGGAQNAAKLRGALAGTRAIERAHAGDGKASLAALHMASEHDQTPPTSFRTIERELCRVAALRAQGRNDEATLILESLLSEPLTPRQQERRQELARLLGILTKPATTEDEVDEDADWRPFGASLLDVG
jgi:hypothetical protein